MAHGTSGKSAATGLIGICNVDTALNPSTSLVDTHRPTLKHQKPRENPVSFCTAQGRHPSVSSHPAVSLPEDPTVTVLCHTPHCQTCRVLTSLSSLKETHLFFPFLTSSLGKTNDRKSQIWVENLLGKSVLD